MANKTALNTLSPREAVIDALSRCLQGVDSNDQEMFESAMLKTEDFHFILGNLDLKGWTAYGDFAVRLFNLTTTHFTSNVRVEFKDADAAHLVCHILAHHWRPEDTNQLQDKSFTAGSLFYLDLVKDSKDDLWKIKKMEIRRLWATGDESVVQ